MAKKLPAKNNQAGLKISVVIEHDENGYYAFCPELPGCQTEGDTMEETLSNVKEAVGVYIESLTPKERAEILTREVFTTTVNVAAG